MNGRRTIVGLCMLCALLASAIAAQGASAAGTTLVTCASGAGDVGVTFNTAHCLPSEGGSGFGHYKVAQDTTTDLIGTPGSATSKLKATLGGVATTLTSTSLSGTGTIENKKDPGGEHFAEGTGTITYSGVTVTPFTKCFVYEDLEPAVGAKGVVKTQKVRLTTTGTGEKLKITPDTGTVFARFWMGDQCENMTTAGECKIAGTYIVSGSVIATPEGATYATTHTGVTEQNTLKLGTGEPTIKAGIEGSLTLEGSAKDAGVYNALSVTTF